MTARSAKSKGADPRSSSFNPLLSLILPLLLSAALQPRGAAATACSGATYSYGGAACASCTAGASFVSPASGCAPSATLTAGPTDTAFYLSGASDEGDAAFATINAPSGISYTTSAFGVANGALTLASGSYLAVPGVSAPPGLPSGGDVPWSASAWVRCPASTGAAVVLGWGPAGGAGSALVVQGSTPGALTTTLAGSGSQAFADGAGAAASFFSPAGVAVIPSSGIIVVTDVFNNRIRLVSPSGLTSTLAGSGRAAFADGEGAAASFNNPSGVSVIPSSGIIVVTDTSNHRIRLVSPSGLTSTLAGSGSAAFADGMGTAASFNQPQGVAVIPSSGVIVVVDCFNNRIRLVSPTGLTSTLAGSGVYGGFADGTGAAARFYVPQGVAVIPSSGFIVVADSANNRVRLVSPSGLTSTLAGSGSAAFADGAGPAASFNFPNGVAFIPSSGVIVVADIGNNRVRLVSPSGLTSTLAGSGASAGFIDGAGAAARFNYPNGVAFIPSTGVIVVADASNNRIRTIQYFPSILQACDGTWRHVALTYTPTPAPSLSTFLDGALVLANVGASITLPAAASSVMTVGWSGDLAANGGSFFAGALAELRIYSRALPTAEVVALSQPPLFSFPRTSTSPPGPGLYTDFYTWLCMAGSAGPAAVLYRDLADNSWAWAGGVTPACSPCLAGSSSGSGSPSCSPCPPGTYSLAGAAACTPCPYGTYGSRAGLATAACSGVCAVSAACPAGTAYPPPAAGSALSCAATGSRAVPGALGLQLWPAAAPGNTRQADLVVAPLAACQALTGATDSACGGALSVVGTDGVARFAVGTAAQLHMQAAATMTCSST